MSVAGCNTCHGMGWVESSIPELSPSPTPIYCPACHGSAGRSVFVDSKRMMALDDLTPDMLSDFDRSHKDAHYVI